MFQYRTSLMAIIFFLHLFEVSGQSSKIYSKVTVSYQETTLGEVLSNLSEASGVQFSYSAQRIDLERKVNYKADNKELIRVIDEIFQHHPIKYEIVNEHIIIKKGKVKALPPPEQQPSIFTLSGTVLDQRNGELLIGTTVFIEELGIGTICNRYGFYSLTLPPGIYTLVFSFIGYDKIKLRVDLRKNMVFNQSLQALTSKVQEVVISSRSREKIIFEMNNAQSEIHPAYIRKQAAVLGESDVLKSLESIPGVNYLAEGSSYFNVRGGQRDQNLILIDEAPVYNPSHLLGLFSTVIPEAVKKTDIYKADFPINYGGRTSSVVDIQTKDGNMNKFSGSGSMGLISTRLSLEGPFKKNASSYFISARKSYFGLVFKAAEPGIEKFNFYDFTSKFNVKLGNKDRLFLTLYNGNDVFLANENETTSGLSWGNSTITLRWNHIYGPRLFGNTTWYYSKYDYYFYTDYNADLYWNSHISNSSLKTEFTFFQSPTRKIKFGFNTGAYEFNPGNYSQPNLDISNTVSRNSSTEIYFYLGAEEELGARFLLNYGLRLTNWMNFGESFVVDYDEAYKPTGITEYADGELSYANFLPEPRLSLTFKASKKFVVKGSYNRTIQNINMISNSLSPFNTLEVWLPASSNIKPQKADIINLGLIKSLPKAKLELQTDIYYKWMQNQLGYAYHPYMMLNPLIEGEIRQGEGRAYGIEFQLRKEMGKLSGWLSYSYSRSLLTIQGLNADREFPAYQDKPHSFSVNLSYQLRPRWLATAGYTYLSGARITTPSSFFNYRGTQVPVYSEQNNDMLPAYRRFDLATTINLNNSDGAYRHSITLALYNLFWMKNPALLYFNKTYSEHDEALVVPSDKLNQSELTPSYRYVFSTVPSISYNFNF